MRDTDDQIPHSNGFGLFFGQASLSLTRMCTETKVGQKKEKRKEKPRPTRAPVTGDRDPGLPENHRDEPGPGAGRLRSVGQSTRRLSFFLFFLPFPLPPQTRSSPPRDAPTLRRQVAAVISLHPPGDVDGRRGADALRRFYTEPLKLRFTCGGERFHFRLVGAFMRLSRFGVNPSAVSSCEWELGRGRSDEKGRRAAAGSPVVAPDLGSRLRTGKGFNFGKRWPRALRSGEAAASVVTRESLGSTASLSCSCTAKKNGTDELKLKFIGTSPGFGGCRC